MSAAERALALMRGEGRGPKAALARAGLWLLSLLYGAGITIYWWLYRFGVLRRVRPRAFVISVGNLTVGGTGKTTAIQHLARRIQGNGLRVAILSYGYRAASRDSVSVVSDGISPLMGVDDAGDEATLLAESLPGAAVLIGRRRALSSAVAEERFEPDVLLCDDAFQYWRLARDLDILLVDAVEPWGYGHLLPRGLLREPKRQARRADAILITHSDLVEPARVDALRRELEASGHPVWLARHEPHRLVNLASGQVRRLEDLRGAAVTAVSSLGDPASFEKTLERLGARVCGARYPDHHHYTSADVASVEGCAADSNRMLVTTAKDAVKIRRLGTRCPWWVLEIALHIADEDTFHAWLNQVINAPREKN